MIKELYNFTKHLAATKIMEITWMATKQEEILTEVCFVWADKKNKLLTFKTSTSGGSVPIEAAKEIRRSCGEDKLRIHGPQFVKIYLFIFPSAVEVFGYKRIKEFGSLWDGVSKIHNEPLFSYYYPTCWKFIKKTILRG